MRLLKMITLMLFAAAPLLPVAFTSAMPYQSATEAPTGFDDRSNGLVPQEQFDRDKEVFDELKLVSDGLGLVYNEPKCTDCHRPPRSGLDLSRGTFMAGHFEANSSVGRISTPAWSRFQPTNILTRSV